MKEERKEAVCRRGFRVCAYAAASALKCVHFADKRSEMRYAIVQGLARWWR